MAESSPDARPILQRIASLVTGFFRLKASDVLLADGWRWPLPVSPDGRAPVVSDGYHVEYPRNHRGCDLMYRRPTNGVAELPWKSRGFEMIPGTQAVAPFGGKVTVARELKTGWAVAMDHGGGVESAMHHLRNVCVAKGDVIDAGTPVGEVGWNPVGYKLAHLHFDLLVKGKFVDPGPQLKWWPKLSSIHSPSATLPA